MEAKNILFALLALLLLAEVDVSHKHGDQQYDGEAGEQPRVLDQEEHKLGGGAFLVT